MPALGPKEGHSTCARPGTLSGATRTRLRQGCSGSAGDAPWGPGQCGFSWRWGGACPETAGRGQLRARGRRPSEDAGAGAAPAWKTFLFGLSAAKWPQSPTRSSPTVTRRLVLAENEPQSACLSSTLDSRHSAVPALSRSHLLGGRQLPMFFHFLLSA